MMSQQNGRIRNWFGQICAVVDSIKAVVAKIVIEEISLKKFGDLPFKANIQLKISDIPQKKINFDNLPPPKALRVNHRTNHSGADITQNCDRLSVVHHPLKPPLQSSLTQHLHDKSACQICHFAATNPCLPPPNVADIVRFLVF
jgi:hypothetical protein